MEKGNAIVTFGRHECLTADQLYQQAAAVADKRQVSAHEATEIVLQRHIETIESQRDARDARLRMLGSSIVPSPEFE